MMTHEELTKAFRVLPPDTPIKVVFWSDGTLEIRSGQESFRENLWERLTALIRQAAAAAGREVGFGYGFRGENLETP